MGTFLSLSSIVGKTKNEVVNSLTNYAKSAGGGLQQEDIINSDPVDYWNYCIIEEANGNTSVLYPDDFTEWDDSSKFISKELEATVFSFHIHDGDFWMYTLFHNGFIVDQFNPIPDYWDDNLSKEEIDSWKGNAQTIAKFIPSIKASDIDRYLVRWDLDDEQDSKAYPTDEFIQEDWQLIDFMNKLKLPYPVDEDENPKGQSFKFRTKGKVNEGKAERLEVPPFCTVCGGVIGKRQYSAEGKPATFIYLLGGWANGVGAYYKCKSCGAKYPF